MKKLLFKSLFTLMTGFVACTGFTSCSHEDTPEPKKKESHLILPAKAVIKVYEGHLHGPLKFHQNAYPDNVKHIGANQTFTYNMEGGKWVVDASSPKVLAVESGFSQHAITITYYDKDGNVMNSKYVDNGEEAFHQHFFMVENQKPLNDFIEAQDIDKKKLEQSLADRKLNEDQKATDFFSLAYADTTPWDKTNHYDGAKFTGKQNPIGFKNIVNISYAHQKFDLKIRFMRDSSGKTLKGGNGNSNPSPFNQPSAKQLSEAEWYPDIVLPVVVYMNHWEKDAVAELDEDTPEKDCPAEALRTIKSVASTFGITYEQALKEIYDCAWGERNPESSQFWF